MEHIKKKLAVIVVFFAVFIGIVTIWTVRKQSQPKLTAVTWKLEEEADLDGNELSSYAKDPSKSKVVLTFKKDQTYRCKNLENKKPAQGRFYAGFRDVTGGLETEKWCPKPESNRHVLTNGGF